ncbi:demethylmenaquinone methyltransferase [Effusibacillus lacus]|uniref:Demethylmenaquinone methyltransferase n=1 Tax=Effusibacillus lacus TaxID=1348429 RepID=A0A292YML6_9BACL|nr:demethylmenaquinone methyltransferase [Effusibacillus lacus]TCS75282.1 demethylmenaquinone methyltransferase/2-methoxy-6-polyprenyl-1,4-benzoquinol methylase [Effusibacillus lacus]GAX89720.1 ubiquinone biosynthesis methyltransferase UbiE [Effusibacillus lacus]
MNHFNTKEEKVHYIFSKIAKRYDLMNSVLSFRQHKLWRSYTMKRMNVQPGQSAIDVCTGTGDWAISIAEAAGPQGRVVGVDFCEPMLEEADRKILQKGLANQVKMVHGNAMALPFESDTFDYATIGFALRNVPDVQHVIGEMARVVKPGGMVVSLELSKPEWPPFRALYYFYFEKILPKIGNLASRDNISYSWLPESLRSFPDRKGLEGIFRNAGLERVESKTLTGGIAAMHIGYKPQS